MNTQNKPTVSIIIATFNASKVVRTALDSVKNQLFQDWECLIVDGASKDNTIDVVKEYVAEDSRFRYVSEPDKGIYDAFNKGWKLAAGEWIYYLGADDYLTKDGMYEMFSSSSDADCMYGAVYRNKYNGKKISKDPLPTEMKLGKMISHQAIVMKRELIELMNGFDLRYRVSADFDLVTRSLKHGALFEMHPIYLAYFSDGGASSSMQPLKDSYKIRINNGLLTKKEARLWFIKRYLKRLYWAYIKWPLAEVVYRLRNK